MFARGLVSGHPTKDVHPELVEGSFSYSTPPLLGRKPSSVKSRVSISSKLIEIKGLQVHYFGHLRKTGERGSYQLVYATHDLVRISPPLTPAFPTLAHPSPNHFIFNNLRAIGVGVGGLVIPVMRDCLLDYSEAEAAKCSAGAGSLRWTD
jgi:hypothetical protein